MTDTLLLDALVFPFSNYSVPIAWGGFLEDDLPPDVVSMIVDQRVQITNPRRPRFVWFGFELLFFCSQSSGETSLFKLRCFFGSVYFQLGSG